IRLNDASPTDIYTLSLHDALPILGELLLFPEDKPRAVQNEIEDLRFLIRADSALWLVAQKSLPCCADAERQRHRQFPLQDDLDDAKRGATQRVRITRSCGNHAYGQAADHGIEFVGERHRAAG